MSVPQHSENEKKPDIDVVSMLAYERTRLASERTFLSWIRTGLTSIGIGIAIAKLLFFQEMEHRLIAHIIGELLILWGIVIFIFSLISYHQAYKQLGLTSGSKNNLIGIGILTLTLVFMTSLLFLIIG